MRQPFSMLSPPGVQRSAVGEGGYHLPLQPDLSGQDAVDSLIGYYPTRRMDSMLNPRTYQRPAGLRSTTMPNTKVANLREKYAYQTLAALQLHRSEFVQGFLVKCAEAQLPYVQIMTVVQAAIRTHPVIAHEFAKCGMTKQAVGSTNGLGSLLSGPSLTGPAVPKPPTPPPVPAHPAAMAAKLQLPVKPQMPIPEGPSTGFGKGLAQGVKNTTGAIYGGAKGGVAAGLGVVTSPARLLGNTGTAFNNSLWGNAAASGRDVLKAFHPTESSQPHGYNSTLVQQQQQQLQSSGDHLQSRILGAADGVGHTATNLAAGGGAVSGVKTLAQGLGSAVPRLAPVANAVAGTARAVEGVTKSPIGPAGAVTGAEFAQPTVNEVAGTDESGKPNLPVSISGAVDKYVNGQTQQQSAITQSPMYSQIEGLVQQDPEQAGKLAEQAKQQLSGALETPEGKAEAESAAKNGTLSPQGQQKAVTALTGEGYDWDHATKTVQNMNGWEQLGLWGGLGMGALGLLHAISGGGGVGSIIMALLGLGAAGFTAGKAGLLDQGSQDLTQGLSDTFMGGAGPEISPTLKSTLPTLLGDATGVLGQTAGGMLNSGRDALANTALQQLATSNPDMAKQLDRAAGTGSWGNAAMAQVGDMSGMRQRMMQDKLGLNPQQQDKLLQLWTKMRASGGVTK